jgi:hypothetical protein
MADETMVTANESEFRNKVCLKLGNIEGRLDAGENNFLELKQDIKDVRVDVKALSSKIDKVLNVPIAPCLKQGDTCAPMKAILSGEVGESRLKVNTMWGWIIGAIGLAATALAGTAWALFRN